MFGRNNSQRRAWGFPPFEGPAKVRDSAKPSDTRVAQVEGGKAEGCGVRSQEKVICQGAGGAQCCCRSVKVKTEKQSKLTWVWLVTWTSSLSGVGAAWRGLRKVGGIPGLAV